MTPISQTAKIALATSSLRKDWTANSRLRKVVVRKAARDPLPMCAAGFGVDVMRAIGRLTYDALDCQRLEQATSD
jgi:hypothetical protein